MAKPINSSRVQAIQIAQNLISKKPVYLDTETTGLSNSDEIVEIAIIDHDGAVIFDELIKPSKQIPRDAIAIHGIDNIMVDSAKRWPVLWPTIRSKMVSRAIGIYNANFDLRMMRQSLEVYNMPWREKLNSFDILEIYARFYGEWDPRKRAYRYQSLEKAGRQCGISLPNSHRAKDDTLLTREVLHFIANSKE